MKFYLVSDNIDTQIGMRLAGIEGVVLHEKDEVEAEIEKIAKDPEVGIILVTKKLVELCEDYIYDFKLNRKRPLIVETTDRHSSSNIASTISKYVENAIGIKL